MCAMYAIPPYLFCTHGNSEMGLDRDRKEVRNHGAHGAHNAPIAFLRAKFGLPDCPPTRIASFSLPTDCAGPTKTEILPRKTPAPAEPSLPADWHILPDPAAGASCWDLDADRFARWEERVCIMHYDGGLSWPDAERKALADVVACAGPIAELAEPPTANVVPPTQASTANPPASPMIQAQLFATERSVYA